MMMHYDIASPQQYPQPPPTNEENNRGKKGANKSNSKAYALAPYLFTVFPSGIRKNSPPFLVTVSYPLSIL